MQYELLNTLHAVGERMCTALEQDDLDVFYPLLEERAGLIRQLSTLGRPTTADAAWEALATAIRGQQDRLATALAHQERQFSEAVGALYRARTARRRYRARPHRPSLLHKNLHG